MVVLERKKFKEFGLFRLNVPIKISYIPDFEIFYQGIQKILPKKYFVGNFLNKKELL